MSLLLDALKRAEQAKQSTGAGQGTEPGALPPSPEQPAIDLSAPGSGLTLEAIAEPSRSTQPRAIETTDRDSVRNVFAAKQPTSAVRNGMPSWLLPVIAVVAVTISGGGWFVWNELNKLSPATRIAAAPAPKSVTTVTPSAPQAAPAQQVPESKPETTQPSTLPEPPPDSRLTKIPLPDSVAGGRTALSAADRAREELARSLRAANKSPEPPVALKLARGIEPPKVSEALAEAYTALRAGKNTEARKLYESLVRADGMNLDARLGLATSLARSGETAAAGREYRKALEIDPRNSTALAALLVLTEPSAAPSLEADLRALLTRHADSAELHYALGNLLASQSRWTEAQQAYFDAWRHGGDNPDYAFNLAVSLDQLRQSRLAAEYYQKALSLAARNGAQFDRRQAERRANELKSVLAAQ